MAEAHHSRSRLGLHPNQTLAAGPVVDATSLGAPLLLDKEWRVGVTADPAAAQPGFDDLKWPIRNAARSIEEVPDEDTSGAAAPQNRPRSDRAPAGFHAPDLHRYAWFRLHIRLAPNHGPIALLIELPVSRNTTFNIADSEPPVNVYANGERIVPSGPHATNVGRYQEISRIYNLNVPAGQTDLTLSIRALYIPFGYFAYTGFFANRTLRLGDPGDLQQYVTLWNNRNLFERLPRLVYSVLLVVLTFFLLALFFAQKGHNEYLWLALHYLAQTPIGFLALAGTAGQLGSQRLLALVVQLYLVSAYLFFEFLISFLSLRRRWYIQALRYTAPLLGTAAPALLLVGHAPPFAVSMALVSVGLFALAWMTVWLLFMLVTLIAASARRNWEAGLLLIPLLLSIVGSIEPAVTAGMSDITGRPLRTFFTIMAGPIPIHLSSVAEFTGVLVIIIIIFGRFLRIQREQQRATSELAAARTVQELMIPPEKVATPGFEIISVYDPANEVGGDFFHVQAMGDGGVLVVIGDVAGKGLKAAMNVSTIMGALRIMGAARRGADQSPARILESLNRVLIGSESFTTCQAAWFGANGELVLANAGHLPPYLNSQEIAVHGGLPLGVVADLKYDEIRLYAHPGDRLLFLSDGVVEARRPSGELFGFDRVNTLAGQSAGYIADAAKTFGQADDITVLTVRRLAQSESARQPGNQVNQAESMSSDLSTASAD